MVSAILAIQTIAGARRSKFGSLSFRSAWLSVHGYAAACAAAPVPAAVARMLAEPPCALYEGLAFYILLPVAGAFFGASLGLAVASSAKTTGRGYLLLCILAVISIGYSLQRVAVTPAVYSYNPLFGYFPGPIYDYETGFPAALVISRILVIVAMAPLAVLARALLSPGSLHHRRLRMPGAIPATIAVIGITILATAWFFRFEAGLETSRRFHASIMSGTFETPHFEIHFEPGTFSPQEIAWHAAEHEFRYDQLRRFFGSGAGGSFKSYLYSSQDRKKKLMGAGRTQMIDPLERSLHLNPSRFPLPLLRHEIAHLFTLDFGLPVIGISISPGLLEGIAVAADWQKGSRRPHAMAASLLARGIPPNAVNLIDPLRFWSGSGTKSYNLAGSFVRFLIDKYGIRLFREVYPTAAFERVYGKPLSKLSDEWVSFLASVPLDSINVPRNTEQMQQPSIFVERNVRFKAGRTAEARRLLAGGDSTRALELCDNVLSLSPGYLPAARLAIGILAGGDEPVKAADLLEKNKKLFNSTISGRNYYLRERGELHWLTGELLEARRCFTEIVLTGGASRSTVQGYVRLYSLDLPEPDRRAALRILRNPGDGSAIAILRSSSADNNTAWLSSYIIGRALIHEGRFFESAEYLAIAEKACTTLDAVRLETMFFLGKALFRTGRFSDAEQVFSRLSLNDAGGIYESDHWIERCRWFREYTVILFSGDDPYPGLVENPAADCPDQKEEQI